MCVLTNERYKTYQTGFLFCRLGHVLGVGLGGTRGAKIKFRPAVCPLCYLLLNHWTKFNQIWCVSYSHEWGTQRQFFCGPTPWGPGEGSKGQISFNFNYKVNFKDFYSKLCVCSHKLKIQNISDGFFYSVAWVMPQGWDFWALGVPRGVKKKKLKHGHVAYQMDGDDMQNRMQVTFSF